MPITLTTDFGPVYPSIMKGVILSICGEATVIDVTCSIPRGDVVRGAFALRFASQYFPPGSIHLAVVDPGVGGTRRALVVKGETYSFVGPDNGLLLPAARAQGKFTAYEITDLSFYTEHVSPVFHGRDVFAPAAAFLLKGREIPGLKAIRDAVDLDFGTPELKGDGIAGTAIYVDGFGNVVTNIGGNVIAGLAHPGDTLDINGAAVTFVYTYCEAPQNSLVLLVGSHGMAEVACNGDDAATLMGLKPGDRITIALRGGKAYEHSGISHRGSNER